jgi:hypothetical protein
MDEAKRAKLAEATECPLGDGFDPIQR